MGTESLSPKPSHCTSESKPIGFWTSNKWICLKMVEKKQMAIEKGKWWESWPFCCAEKVTVDRAAPRPKTLVRAAWSEATRTALRPLAEDLSSQKVGGTLRGSEGFWNNGGKIMTGIDWPGFDVGCQWIVLLASCVSWYIPVQSLANTPPPHSRLWFRVGAACPKQGA